MSQNKTIVPDSNFDNSQDTGGYDIYADLYRPSSATSNNRTFIVGGPAEEPDFGQAASIGKEPAATTQDSLRNISMQPRVVVGVLFSVSRSMLGEIFPIYMGHNAIGSDPGCDIRLTERTVSSNQAILSVRQEGVYDECIMTLTDHGSTHGTMVNNTDCRYETLQVRDNDIVSIGRHYKFIVKLFDPKRHGLTEDPMFEDTSGTAGMNITDNSDNDFYAPTSDGGTGSRTVMY